MHRRVDGVCHPLKELPRCRRRLLYSIVYTRARVSSSSSE